MSEQQTKVVYSRPSKGFYLMQILLSFVTLRVFRDMLKLFAYYEVNYVLGRKLAKIGKESKVHSTVIIRQGERVSIGSGCLINHNNIIQAGKDVGRVEIGDYVQTGPNVMIFAFNHGIEMCDTPMILQDYVDSDVIIEDDVWIGAGTVVTAGVRIGKGCVIGAGSVVTKDMPANMICAGVPCRPIKPRK